MPVSVKIWQRAKLALCDAEFKDISLMREKKHSLEMSLLFCSLTCICIDNIAYCTTYNFENLPQDLEKIYVNNQLIYTQTTLLPIKSFTNYESSTEMLMSVEANSRLNFIPTDAGIDIYKKITPSTVFDQFKDNENSFTRKIDVNKIKGKHKEVNVNGYTENEINERASTQIATSSNTSNGFIKAITMETFTGDMVTHAIKVEERNINFKLILFPILGILLFSAFIFLSFLLIIKVRKRHRCQSASRTLEFEMETVSLNA